MGQIATRSLQTVRSYVMSTRSSWRIFNLFIAVGATSIAAFSACGGSGRKLSDIDAGAGTAGTSNTDASVGGSGGAAAGSVCDDLTTPLTANDTFISNFEPTDPHLAMWVESDDMLCTSIVGLGTPVAAGGAGGAGGAPAAMYGGPESPGAAGTQYAGHLVGDLCTSWGASLSIGFGSPCVDVTVFDGISFWAKGGATTSSMDVQVGLAATTATTAGGDCLESSVPGCWDHPRKDIILTTEWQHFTITWAEFKQQRWGLIATWPTGVIMQFDFAHDAGSFDFWIDEIALYKGTAPAGAVTPPTNAGGAGGSGGVPSTAGNGGVSGSNAGAGG
jgi:hypothetical protein